MRGYQLGWYPLFSVLFGPFQNASAFDMKRKCISLQTQVRFTSNASAFYFKHKGVLVETQVRFWGMILCV
jgi:hypothetical protein